MYSEKEVQDFILDINSEVTDALDCLYSNDQRAIDNHLVRAHQRLSMGIRKNNVNKEKISSTS